MAQIRTLNFKEDILFSFATWHVLMIILFAIFSDYAFEETIEARYALEHSNGSLPLAELLEGIHVDQGENSQDAIRGRQVYEYYKDIAVMIFIGFGFLMTFLKKYGFGAVGFTFLISSIAAEWTILNDAFWVCIHEGCGTSLPFIKLDVLSLVFGMFGAGAVMISFGAVLGKVSANQMFLLALLEVVFYSVNVYVGYLVLEVIDVGGSAFIHLFGAYFGLGATYFLTPEKSKRNFRDNESAYHSDLFSFIGTVFLWIYWPSFNAVLVDQQYQNRALVNTVLSLMSACIMAFFASRTLRHAYFDAVDIQNATLAGGVAVGASCNFAIQPFGAMCAGGFAGFMSVVGYRYVQAKVEAWGFHDTCGVHNLHGIPGVIGSLVGVIATAILANTKESELAQMPHGTSQWAFQLAGSVISFAIAVVGGLFSGFVTSKLMPPSEINYTDELFWSVPTAPIAFTRDDIRDDIVRVHAARTASSSVEDVEAGEMYAAAAAKADTVTAKPTGTTRKGKATSETENADKDKGKGKDKASKAKAKAKEAKSASVTASGSYYSYTS